MVLASAASFSKISRDHQVHHFPICFPTIFSFLFMFIWTFIRNFFSEFPVKTRYESVINVILCGIVKHSPLFYGTSFLTVSAMKSLSYGNIFWNTWNTWEYLKTKSLTYIGKSPTCTCIHLLVWEAVLTKIN